MFNGVETTGEGIGSLLRGVEITGECVVETTGDGIASEGLKGPGKSFLRGVETVGEGVVPSENCKAPAGSTEEKCGNNDGVSCPS